MHVSSLKGYNFVQLYLLLISVITGVLGFVVLLRPEFIVGLFFTRPLTDSLFFARMLGSTLIGYAVVNFLAGRTTMRPIHEVAVWGNMATLLLASIISVFNQPHFDKHATLIIGQHLAFLAGFSYCAVLLYRQEQ
jgi:hypothetical protein